MSKTKELLKKYSPQFWLLYISMFIAMTAGTMIWPFFLIYASHKLDISLAQTASLMTINASVGIIFTFLAGSILDKFGRKWIMIFGLIINASAYLFLNAADSYLYFAVLMVITGFSNPLFRVGADAMLTDIVPEEKRLDAFALTRIGKNIGVAMGPAIGGFLANIDYSISFSGAAGGMFFLAFVFIFFAKETLPKQDKKANTLTEQKPKVGYRDMFADKEFMTMVAFYTLGWTLVAMIWILMPVYANQQYGIPENQYGLIPAANGLMVIIFQVYVTNRTKRFKPLPLIAFGMAVYTLGTGSVAFATSFWGFFISIVIITIGELIIVPTSSAYVANRAHPEMRGRYMGVYNFSWSFARGVGPVMGGWMSDNYGPTSIWYGGFLVGTLSSLGLFALALYSKRKEASTP